MRWLLFIRLVPAAATVCASALVVACGASDDPGVSAGDASAAPLPPSECAVEAAPNDWSFPQGPYGTEVGDRMADFTLDDCDGDPVRFGDILAGSQLVLVNIGAGWCEPCVEETETLDSDIFRRFCGRGLGVSQVLFQDTKSRPASKLFCSQWRQQYQLSFPVVVDPLFTTEDFFESVQSQTPINVLVDSAGEIVFRSTGAPPADLAERIDELLPE